MTLSISEWAARPGGPTNSTTSVSFRRAAPGRPKMCPAWQIDAYRFDAPILSHPTDALVSPESAIDLGRLGALGVINGEGLWARHRDVENKIDQLIDVATTDPDPRAAVRCLQELAPGAARSRTDRAGGGARS